MELKALLLGLIFSLASFGVKGGLGLAYPLKTLRAVWAKALALILYAALYLILFEASYYAIERAGLLKYLDKAQIIFQYGQVIHFLMAGGLILWGISLLKTPHKKGQRIYGWLGMIIPCPVCASAILLIAWVMVSFYPDSGHTIVLGAYAVFMAISLPVAAITALWPYGKQDAPAQRLGFMMLVVGAYFVLSLLLCPHFKDMDKIYRLASYKGQGADLDLGQVALTLTGLIAFFAIGFLRMHKKIKRAI